MARHGLRLGPALSSLTLAVVLATGCGGGEEQSPPAAPTPVSGAQTPEAPRGDRPARRPQEQISITNVDPDGSEASASLSPPGEGTSGIASTGVATLSFEVEQPSRLAWSNTGGRSFVARGNGVSISSAKGRGEVEVAPGDYGNFYVSGADWRIVIRPR